MEKIKSFKKKATFDKKISYKNGKKSWSHKIVDYRKK